MAVVTGLKWLYRKLPDVSRLRIGRMRCVVRYFVGRGLEPLGPVRDVMDAAAVVAPTALVRVCEFRLHYNLFNLTAHACSLARFRVLRLYRRVVAASA